MHGIGNRLEEAVMSLQQQTTETSNQVSAAIPSCALDEAGVREQRARYACLAPAVTGLGREAEALLIEFRENFDRQTLEQALEVEHACCPFFRFEVDESGRRLRVTVREPDQLPALDAMAYALGAAHRTTSIETKPSRPPGS
jgi:hypothetical protein